MIENSDLAEAVKDLILEFGKRSGIKKFPSSVQCYDSKPAQYLSGGDCLFTQGLKQLSSGKIEIGGIQYGGSYDSIMYHLKEQLAEGQTTVIGNIGLFITECAGAGTRIWTVDVWVGQADRIIDSNRKQIE